MAGLTGPRGVPRQSPREPLSARDGGAPSRPPPALLRDQLWPTAGPGCFQVQEWWQHSMQQQPLAPTHCTHAAFLHCWACEKWWQEAGQAVAPAATKPYPWTQVARLPPGPPSNAVSKHPSGTFLHCWSGIRGGGTAASGSLRRQLPCGVAGGSNWPRGTKIPWPTLSVGRKVLSPPVPLQQCMYAHINL